MIALIRFVRSLIAVWTDACEAGSPIPVTTGGSPGLSVPFSWLDSGSASVPVLPCAVAWPVFGRPALSVQDHRGSLR